MPRAGIAVQLGSQSQSHPSAGLKVIHVLRGQCLDVTFFQSRIGLQMPGRIVLMMLCRCIRSLRADEKYESQKRHPGHCIASLSTETGSNEWRNSAPFDMIAIMSEALVERLKALSHREITVAANEHVFQIAAPVVSLFMVAEGAVQLERPSPSGTRLILQRARAGDILAEASCLASHYHCSGVAVGPCLLLSIPMKSFTAECRADPSLAMAFAEHLARQTQSARARSEILSLKTVSARLDAWLEMGDGSLPAKGEWNDLAGMLCVTPEALYRELSRRRKLTGIW